MSDTVQSVRDAAKEHPGHALGRRLVLIASMFGVLAALSAILSAWTALPLGAMAALYAWLALHTRRSVTPIVLVNRAYASVMSGDRAFAIELLDVAAHVKVAQSRRLVAYHRCVLALAAGNAKEAEAQATLAMNAKADWYARDLSRLVIALAASQRALARAIVHDDEGALTDARIALDPRDASPESIANAEIAQALVAAYRGRKDEVCAILDRAKPFLGDLGERKREIVRRLDKSARPKKHSVYRHAAKADEDESVDALVAAPQRAAVPIAAASTDAKPPAVKSVGILKRRFTRVVLSVIIVCALGAAVSLGHGFDTGSQSDGSVTIVTAFASLLAVVFYALIGRSLYVAANARMRRRRAVIAALRGDAQGIAELERTARSSADAALDLARLYEARGDFERALSTCDTGIALAASTPAARIVSYDVTHPGLYAERAFCFAALGREADATAVMAAMPNGAMYAYAPSARLRVRFAQAMARGDRAAALEIARTRGDAMPLPRRDAMLIDLLEATEGRGASDEEWSRIHAELAADPALATWIDHFMPKNTLQKRVVTNEPIEDEEEEEEEAEALTSL